MRCLKSLTRYAAGRLPPAPEAWSRRRTSCSKPFSGACSGCTSSRSGTLERSSPTCARSSRNLIVDYARAGARPQQVALDEHQADRGQSPLERVLDGEQIELYEAALERLKPRDAALVTLKIDEQLGYDEIAAELGLSSANAARVATRTRRASARARDVAG